MGMSLPESLKRLELNSNSKRYHIILYSVMFIITALCSYVMFIMVHKTFLTDANGNVDGIAQLYPAYTEIKRMIGNVVSGNGLEVWTWDIGLGDNSMINFSSKLLNPLTYIVIAFPYEHIDIGFTLMIVVTQYLCGLSFMAFGRRVNLGNVQNAIGGLSYAFCGWAIWAIGHMATFLTAMALLPLLILGAEKILNRQSPLLFIAAVAMHMLYSVQWSYIGGITVVIYFVVRYVTEYNDGDCFIKELGMRFLQFCGYGIVGMMISAAVFIPNVMQLRNAVTSSTVKNEVLYSISQYLRIPSGFFAVDCVTGLYSVLAVSSICVILIPAGIKKIRQKNTAAIMTAVFFAASLIPVTGRIFNGMGYSSGRWFYVLIFFLIWMCMESLHKESFSSSNVRLMLVWVCAAGIYSMIVNGVILENASDANLTSCVFGLIFALLLIYVCIKYYSADRKKNHGIIAILLVIVSIAAYVNVEMFPYLGGRLYEFRKAGSIEEVLADSTQRVGCQIQAEDATFYRNDQVDGYTDRRFARVRANENMYFGNRSIYSYSSTIPGSWLEFNKLVGNNCGYFDRTTSYSNDNREGLDLLMGVKYFLGDSTTKKPGASEYAAYGFDDYKVIDGVSVLKNKYDIGLGTAFDKYITESEWLEYSPLEREQVLLQAAVVKDEDVDKLNGVKHASSDEIRTCIKEVPFEISGANNLDFNESDKTITVTGTSSDVSGFDITLPEMRNCRVMISFDGLTKRELPYSKVLELSNASDDRNRLAFAVKSRSYDDNDKFKIEVTKGNIVKAAQVRKGKNQGLNDVEDFNINLGYFDSISGKVNINIDTKGIYDYEDIHVYAVPMDIYDENARILEDSKFHVRSFSDDVIEGTLTAKEDSVLFLSIIDNGGWEVTVDGKKVSSMDDVDVTFKGICVDAGTHEVVLKYHTPNSKIGLALTLSGVTILILIAIRRKRHGN